MPWRHRIRIMISNHERGIVLSPESRFLWGEVSKSNLVLICGLIYSKDEVQAANARLQTAAVLSALGLTICPKRWRL